MFVKGTQLILVVHEVGTVAVCGGDAPPVVALPRGFIVDACFGNREVPGPVDDGDATMPEDYSIGPFGIDCQEWSDSATSSDAE